MRRPVRRRRRATPRRTRPNSGVSARIVSNRLMPGGRRIVNVEVRDHDGARRHRFYIPAEYGASWDDVRYGMPGEPTYAVDAAHKAIRAKRGPTTRRNGPKRSARRKSTARRTAAPRRTKRNAAKVAHGFRKGDRVQAHPATDAWMSGDRYGDVSSVTATKVRVRMDRSGRVRSFAPHNLLPVD